MKAYSKWIGVAVALILTGVAGCGEDFADKPQATVVKGSQATETPPGDVAGEPAAPAVPAEPAAPAADVKTYAIDADESTIGWEGSKVTETHIGGFADFSGTVIVPGGDLEKLTVEVLVHMASLYSDAGGLTEVMMDPKFFDVATHPESTFKSTAVKKGEGEDQYMVSGDFTLNGVTNNITFPATITVDGGTLTATSEFAINRLDWNVVYQGVGDGIIYDKALIRFEAIAKEKAAE